MGRLWKLEQGVKRFDSEPSEGLTSRLEVVDTPIAMRTTIILLGWILMFQAAGLSALRAAQPLNVFIWSEYLDPEVVRDFEKQFDAKLTIDLYEDAESMLTKLQSATGAYDIVVPPDHSVPVMVKLGLLTPLRREKIPNFKNLDPRFVSMPFDPRNEYTVPYQWGTLGIYVRKAPGKPVPDSWSVLFDPAASIGSFVLIDSMRDAIGIALKFQGHSLNSVTPSELKSARDLLISTKRRSAAFEGGVGGKNRVLARTAAAAIAYSGDAVRGMAEDRDTVYVIPKEGSEIAVDNLAIPVRAPHRDLAERFINYLLDAKVGARISNFTQFATPNAAAREFVKPEDLRNPAIYPPAAILDKLEFLTDVGGATRLYDQVWTEVKAR